MSAQPEADISRRVQPRLPRRKLFQGHRATTPVGAFWIDLGERAARLDEVFLQYCDQGFRSSRAMRSWYPAIRSQADLLASSLDFRACSSASLALKRYSALRSAVLMRGWDVVLPMRNSHFLGPIHAQMLRSTPFSLAGFINRHYGRFPDVRTSWTASFLIPSVLGLRLTGCQRTLFKRLEFS